MAKIKIEIDTDDILLIENFGEGDDTYIDCVFHDFDLLKSKILNDYIISTLLNSDLFIKLEKSEEIMKALLDEKAYKKYLRKKR